MRFEMLGPLRVLDDGAELDLGGPRQRTVLAILLASRPHAVSVDRLVDEVWGDHAPDTAPHVVRTYVSNLRRVLGDRIISDGRRYGIELDGDETDADELATALDRGSRLLESDPVTAYEVLDTAVGLGRGDPFEDLTDDAATVRIAADALEEQCLRAVEARAAASLALGRHEAVLSELEAHAARHPFRDQATAQLMVALYRSGRQVEALRAYRALSNRLGDELGLEPSEDLRDLEQRILLQDPGLRLRPPTNLPAPASTFIGRRVELADVVKTLDAYRLVTLTGIGGVGKTRLAREAATEVLERFPDGVWWVDLASAGHPEQITERIAGVLGIQPQPGVPLGAVLCRFVARRRALVVLDNCEHLAAEAGRVANELLECAPDLKILATSRRPLGTPGEVRRPVPPMSLPDVGTADEVMGTSDAELLFTARAEGAGATVAGDPDVGAICRLLDGIPLAIELAAARASALAPGEVLAELEAGHRFPARTGADPRHRTMEAAIAWSHSLLDDAERLVFARVSTFRNSFDLDAARAVAAFDPLDEDAVVDAIAGLVDASLLVAENHSGTTRYRMLMTVRSVATDHLNASAFGDEAHGRHARHHMDLAAAAGRCRFTPEFTPVARRLSASRADLTAALDWSLDHEPSHAIRAAPGLGEFWSRNGDVADAYHYGRRMLEAAPDEPDEQRAEALLCASFGAALSGDFELAARGPGEALELAAGAGWRTRLWALHAQGQIGTILGDLPTVEAMGRSIIDLCENEGVDLPKAYGRSLLGLAEFFADGDYGVALSHLEAAVEGMRALGDRGGMKIYGLVTAIAAAGLLEEHDRADRYAEEAIALPGLPWTAAAYIVLGGYSLHPRGELRRARLVLERGTRLAYETSTEIWMRTGFLFLARLAATDGDWVTAARLFGACRPNLPAWGLQPRWWETEGVVREALGDAEHTRLGIEAAGEAPEALIDSLVTAPALR